LEPHAKAVELLLGDGGVGLRTAADAKKSARPARVGRAVLHVDGQVFGLQAVARELPLFEIERARFDLHAAEAVDFFRPRTSLNVGLGKVDRVEQVDLHRGGLQLELDVSVGGLQPGSLGRNAAGLNELLRQGLVKVGDATVEDHRPPPGHAQPAAGHRVLRRRQTA